ncbi:MAG: DNA gyrase subunit B [Gemmataceae bacterium]|nr:DNA gyrase subunit B [Gemmataceae bacterium]
MLVPATDTAAASAAPDTYRGENVDVLRDKDHIRARPGMYIGDTSAKGLHHLTYELVYNSVDEALAGYCKNIHVEVDVDGSISVADDGRGIPVDLHPKIGKPTLEVVLTTVGAGAKFDKRTYKTSAGLHGIGAKAVTALSEWTEAQVRRDGKVYVQEYEKGVATTDVRVVGDAPGGRTGTKITFMPDKSIFHDATFDYATLENRLRELAFLNKGLAIRLTDKRVGKEDLFHYEGGVSEFVEWMNKSEEAIHKVLYVDKTVDDVRVEVAFQYTTGEEERVRCYANNAHNPGGGTHLSGFRAAMTRALNAYGTKEDLFKSVTPTGEDFREGLTAVINVQVPEPQFESQTKIRLNNPEVEGIVASVVYEYLAKFLEENPKEASKIMKKVILAAEAREAAAKAKKALKDRKSILNSGGLPGKLMDCTIRDRDASELFLVEGQSAGGSADNGRDRTFQAILPLRGKVLNVEKARVEKMLDNAEIVSLISAVGIDIGNTDDIDGLRYGKIILLTDADVDGQHIRTLLLTFFYRQMRKLIEAGHVYVARPPLFKVELKNSSRYVQTLSEMNEELLERGLEGTRLHILPREGGPTAGGETSAGPLVLEGERLKALVRWLDDLENYLTILERRGLSVATLLTKIKDGKLPAWRVVLGNQEHWFATPEEADKFRDEQIAAGRTLIVADEELKPNGESNGHGELYSAHELHEIKAINRALEKLPSFGLVPTDLVPAPRIAGRDPAVRFELEHGGKKQPLSHLRILVGEIRKYGERGMTVKRFKGLGEMDGEELWETTLDPKRRTLVQVQLEDALLADEMFRVLMGEKVEPRRDFIQKHALEVKDIDYHGA